MMYCMYLVCYVLYVYILCTIYAACLVYCMYLVFCNLLYGSHSSSEIVEYCSDPFEVLPYGKKFSRVKSFVDC